MRLQRNLTATAVFSIAMACCACAAQPQAPTSPSIVITVPPSKPENASVIETPPIDQPSMTTAHTTSTPTPNDPESTDFRSPTDSPTDQGTKNPSLPTTAPSTSSAESIAPTSPSASISRFYGLAVAAMYPGEDAYDDVSHQFVTFYPDGTVLNGVPSEGPEAYAPGLEAELMVDAGRYDVNGWRIVVTWESGDMTDFTVNADDLSFVMYGVRYSFVDSLDAFQMSGTYTRGSGGSGATIQFSEDGRFYDEGIIGDTGLLIEQVPAGAGTYRLGWNTLSLAYDSGQFASVSVYADASSSALVLAGYTFIRL